MMQIEQKIAHILFALLSIACLVTALFTNGNGGVGDSITHFICAKFAWDQPILFFNHWGKPLFTILASPFAQFGFVGIKIFNVICACWAAWLAGLTAKRIGLAHWYWTPLFVMCGSLYFPIMLSGLTEPFSAFLLVLSVYFWFDKKPNWSLTMASLLPFVRSEGLVIILVFATYLIISKQAKKLPWLMLGHLIFSLAGWYFYQDILWVFTKIPYATANSVYGKGSWTHFLLQLYFCLGPVLYIGFWLGSFFQAYQWFDPKQKSNLAVLFLVFGITYAFIAAHTLFWALGIFNSMGLNRVLVTIFPLIGIIIIYGFNQKFSYLNKEKQIWVRSMLILAILIFPFLSNPASIKFKVATQLNEEQVYVKEIIAPYLINKFPNARFMGADPNIALYANINMFDEDYWIYSGLGDPLNKLKSGDLILFDPWYFPTESGINKEDLDSNLQIRSDSAFTFLKSDSSIYNFIIYIKN